MTEIPSRGQAIAARGPCGEFRRRRARNASTSPAGLPNHLPHAFGHLEMNGRSIVVPQVADRDRMQPASGFDLRTIAEKPCDRRGIERGRHDQQFQIGPHFRLQSPGDGQRQIGVERPLVKLVEHDRADAFQQRIILQHADEQSLGQHQHSSLPTWLCVRSEPDSRSLGRAVFHVPRRFARRRREPQSAAAGAAALAPCPPIRHRAEPAARASSSRPRSVPAARRNSRRAGRNDLRHHIIDRQRRKNHWEAEGHRLQGTGRRTRRRNRAAVRLRVLWSVAFSL